jgi:hypothetical protein
VRRAHLVLAVAVLGILGAALPPAEAASEGSFEVGLIGDTGYSSSQDADLLRVRQSMAGYPLAFAVHDGDIQAQGIPCTDARLEYVKGVFDGFAAPFVYTPGDNEWADCSNRSSRLAAIRTIFFSSSETLGQQRMSVERQPGLPENARWDTNGVYFATLDVPGPAGHGPGTTANVEWLNATFDAAESAGAAGVMIIWQDNPFSGGSSGRLVAALKSRTKAFGKPVALVHGDTHHHRVDHPWSEVPNFTRVESYAQSGSRKWIRATVDPSSSSVFSFGTVRAG